MDRRISLNNRYVIKKVIRTERYGILYDADDSLNSRSVWIWELFYGKNQTREEDGITVRLLDPDLTDNYEKAISALKKKIEFLRKSSCVIPILDFFSENGTFYYVMEATDSHSLREAAELKASLSETANPISERRLMTGMIPILETLWGLHEKGYIHYGITPDTLIMDTKGHILLQGVGNPITTDHRDDRSVHFSEAFSGSEIFDTEQKQGAWTDIYSMMAVLYYLLTGIKPLSTVERILFDNLSSPKELDKTISADVSSIIMKGMALRADERYKDEKAVIADIKRVFPDEEKLKKRKGRRLAAGLIIAAVITLIGGGAYYRRNRVRLYFNGEDTVSFYLLPEIKKPAPLLNREDSQNDVEECISGIKERVEVLTEGEKYLWDVMSSGQVRVTIPSKVLGDANREYRINYTLINPWVITRILEGDIEKRDYILRKAWVIADKKTDEYKDKLIVKPENSLMNYQIQKNDDSSSIALPDEALGYGIDMSMFNLRTEYIVDIDVDPEKAGDFFDSSFQAGCFNIDLDEISAYTTNTLYTLSEDKKHMLLMTNQETEPLIRTAAHNIISNPLPGYVPCIYSRDHIVWQDPKSTLIPGENQVNITRIKGPYQLICYPTAWSYTWEFHLKENFDMLGVEYAYGVSMDTKERCIAWSLSKPLEMKMALLCNLSNRLSIGNHFQAWITDCIIEQGDKRDIIISFKMSNKEEAVSEYTMLDKLIISDLILGDCISMTKEDLPEEGNIKITMIFDTAPYVNDIWEMEKIVSLLDAHVLVESYPTDTFIQYIDRNGNIIKEESAREMAEKIS